MIKASTVHKTHWAREQQSIDRKPRTMENRSEKDPGVGARAPQFILETSHGTLRLDQLAARHKNVILTTQDSYRYHPN